MKSTIPNLDGLDRLAFREGIDIRPTLVRVLTDLYVQKPAHTGEEERHYTELVLRLIDAVDVSTRAIVARKLATYAAAPAEVVRRLARDALEVAEPVLKHSQRLSGPELLAVIQDFGPRYAEVIAARRPPPPVFPRERGASSDRRDPAPAASGGRLPVEPQPSSRAAGAIVPEPDPVGATSDLRLGELFLAAGSAERRAILTNADHADIDPPAPHEPAPANEAIGRLEAAALQRKPEEFIREIEAALGVAHELARRIVQDEAGEPLLVAAKSLRMPSAVVLRILLFLDPVIGQSVPRVFDLARFYDRLTHVAASRIIASLRDAAPAVRRAPVHQPLLWNDEADRGRRAAAEASRRPAGQATRARPVKLDPGFASERALTNK